MSESELQLIINARDNASKVLSKVGGSIKKVGSLITKTLAVGITAAATAMAGFVASVGSLAFASQKGLGQFQAQLGASKEEAKELGRIADVVFANNFGENLGDVNQALITTRQQLKGIGDDDLVAVTEGAFALRDAFGVDIAESTNAVKALMEDFGLAGEEALDFITAGFQSGLNSSDDFLDSITEYSTQFKEGGATAGQFFSTLETGLATGMLGTDKAGDLFKEFVVRIQDGSDLTADSLEMIGLSGEKILSQLADGTIEPIDAFQMVQKALRNVDNEAEQMQAGVGLLGTQFEDLGASAVLAINTQEKGLGDLIGTTENLNAQYQDLGSTISGLWRKAQVAAKPFIEGVLVRLTEWFENNEETITNFVNNSLVFLSDAFSYFVENIWPHVQTAFTWLVDFLQVAAPIVLDFVQTAWNALNTAFNYFINEVWPLLKPAFENLIITIQNLFNTVVKLWNFLAPVLIPLLKTLAAVIGIIVVVAVNALALAFRVLSEIIQAAVNLIVGAWNLLRGTWDFVVGSINAGIARLIGFFTTLGDAFSTLSGAAAQKAEAITGFFAKMGDGIKEAFRSSLNFAISLMNKAVNSFNKVIETANKVPGVDIPTIPNVPSLNVGTPLVKQDGLAMIHKGEAVVPASVNPANTGRTAQIGQSMGGGGTVNLNFNVTGMTSKRQTRQMIDNIKDELLLVLGKNGIKPA